MTETKVSLSIILPGRIMFSKQECFKQLKNNEVLVDKTKVNVHRMVIEENKNFSTIHFMTRKCIPASQVINITKEAYEYMTSSECPAWCKPGLWKNLGKTKKLEMHLQRIAEELGGELANYKVFED